MTNEEPRMSGLSLACSDTLGAEGNGRGVLMAEEDSAAATVPSRSVLDATTRGEEFFCRVATAKGVVCSSATTGPPNNSTTNVDGAFSNSPLTTPTPISV